MAYIELSDILDLVTTDEILEELDKEEIITYVQEKGWSVEIDDSEGPALSWNEIQTAHNQQGREGVVALIANQFYYKYGREL